MRIDNWIKAIFDNLYDGILIIDTNEIVKYVNPAYTRITNVPYNEIVGNKLRHVRPGARLQNVLSTKKPIVGALREEFGIQYSVNMSPIFDDSGLVGAISVVSTIDDIYRLYQDIDKYKLKVKTLENRISAIQKAKYTLNDIISTDESSIKVKNIIKKIANKDITVLIYGESGTGKELYANAIHNESDRVDGPFIAVNCASFQGNLLVSELFGYEEGSFTGAKREGKMGLFEAANKGTIFLDEISEMDYEVQAKLLRTLQEGTIRRVGSVKETAIDVRVIAATNKNLEEMVNKGQFRHDLFYRISVFPVTIPPLRKRKNDIFPFVYDLIYSYKNSLKKDIMISKDAESALYNYDWPGNIRELKNTLEFAINMMEDNIIEYNHLPARIQPSKKEFADYKLSDKIREVERQEIIKRINLYGDSIEGKRKAADSLGISLATLYNKLK
ncbi:sigma-54 interaction domain-containing protein [Sedimentibacter sp. MB31-C6]|uniref:sigma-54 interaction domain-containing protein n=1 Tax=Sedimentibacter sp. MB31-C6 TaxID=3109366 RepID=UPI002DDC9415|nr:sigma 54-interacting transcriptional regulator [Sedimentibacter sp. MB36-C1]WSI03573.1 sigma 54-interacting transcriptional regulator [Sedimentibacter sp. MB36-C1]